MTEQTEIKDCCVTGHIHEGEPLGKFEIVHGLRTYVSDPKPPKQGDKQDVVVFITDLFGVDLVNTKLVADSWAGQGSGWKVVVPDLFDGGAVGIEHLHAIAPNLRQKSEKTALSKVTDTAIQGANVGPFLVKFREAVIKPVIENFVKAVKEDPSTGKVVAVGFCWGGRYSMLLAHPDSPAKVDVSVNYHPSFLVEADVSPITDVPTAILKGTEDDIISEEDLDKFEGILSKSLGDKLFVKRYQNAVHGFTVRGDDNAPREKGFKEDAANEGIKFAKKWLGQ